jgi:hypothetical protein
VAATCNFKHSGLANVGGCGVWIAC